MSERYSKLFALPENLYASGSPVVIAAGALLKDNQTGKVLAQLKIRNIGTKSVKAAKVCIRPLDTVGSPLGAEIEYQYLDLSADRNGEFGTKAPISLPDATTRSFSASVAEVIFSDNTVWKATGSPWEPLSAPATLDGALKDRELVKQYHIKFGADCKYEPNVQKDLWYCACGALNRKEETICQRCKKSASSLLSVDMEALKKERDVRIAAEQQKAAEEKVAADAKAKKTMKLAMIVVPIVVVATIAAVLISNVIKKNQEEAARLEAYNAAVAMVEAGQYDEAIAAFEALGEYEDSAKQIELAKSAREEAAIEKANADAYAKAESLLAAGNYAEACATFDALGNYSDSKDRLKESLYHQAVWLLEQGEDEAAYDSFQAAGDYGDAREQLGKFKPMIAAIVYSENDKEVSTTNYEYTVDGNVEKEWIEDSYAVEYTYNSGGALIQATRLNYYYLIAGNPAQVLTDFDANGSPIKMDDEGDHDVWEFDYEYAEDGSILSMMCTYTKRYSDPITEVLNFAEYEGKFYADSSSVGGTMYLKAELNDGTWARYRIYIHDSKIVLEEQSITQNDSYGNPILLIGTNVLGVQYTHTYENTYDEQGNLTCVVKTSDQSSDVLLYEYIYGYMYCPDAA